MPGNATAGRHLEQTDRYCFVVVPAQGGDLHAARHAPWSRKLERPRTHGNHLVTGGDRDFLSERDFHSFQVIGLPGVGTRRIPAGRCEQARDQYRWNPDGHDGPPWLSPDEGTTPCRGDSTRGVPSRPRRGWTGIPHACVAATSQLASNAPTPQAAA